MKLLTSLELCDTLRISRSTLGRLRKRGLPSVGGGRLARFDSAQAVAWFDQHSHQPKTTNDVLQAGDYVCRKCRFTATLDEATDRSKIRTCPQCGAEKASWLRVG